MGIRRLLARLVAVLGVVGVAGCLGAMVAVLLFGSRLGRANDRAFELIDTSLADVRERVVGAQRRVEESKITAEGVEQSIKGRTRKDVGQAIAVRLQAEEKAQRLAAALQQARMWAEVSVTSVRGVRQAMELAGSLGAGVDGKPVEPALAKLVDLMARLQEVAETMETIREQVAALQREETGEERLVRAIQMAGRVVATLGEVDARLGEVAEALAERQGRVRQAGARTGAWITAGTAAGALVLGWLGLGQAALCVAGWRNRGGPRVGETAGRERGRTRR